MTTDPDAALVERVARAMHEEFSRQNVLAYLERDFDCHGFARAALTALRAHDAAEVERMREALERILDLEPEPHAFPSDWSEQIAACAECKRYEGHPIQRGICDTHRRPMWDREAHDERERKAIGWRAKSIARDTLTALATKPSGQVEREVDARAKLTPEYLALSPIAKWEALAANGLLGTDEPWIEDMRATLRTLSPAPAATATAKLPHDVIALVVAAREVMDVGHAGEEFDALDKAVEAFSTRVPYENEPSPPAHADAASLPLVDERQVERGDLVSRATVLDVLHEQLPYPTEACALVRSVPALTATKPSGQVERESGWLIEHGPSHGPVYLTPKLGWSVDSLKALRFARRDDADAFWREQLGSDPIMRVCEHAWDGGR